VDNVEVDRFKPCRGRDWTMGSWRTQKGDVGLGVAYLDCGVGLLHDNNQLKLKQIHAQVATLAIPWFFIGDWNLEPAEIKAWAALLGACIIVARDVRATCTSGRGRCLDFIIASEPMGENITDFFPDPTSPWKPHLGFWVEMSSRPRKVEVWKQRVPRPLVDKGSPTEVALAHAPCGNWRHFTLLAKKRIMESPTNYAGVLGKLPEVLELDPVFSKVWPSATKLGGVFSELSLAAEYYLADKAGIDEDRIYSYLGRGQLPSFKKTLLSSKERETWYVDKPTNFWHALGARLSEIIKAKQRSDIVWMGRATRDLVNSCANMPQMPQHFLEKLKNEALELEAKEPSETKTNSATTGACAELDDPEGDLLEQLEDDDYEEEGLPEELAGGATETTVDRQAMLKQVWTARAKEALNAPFGKLAEWKYFAESHSKATQRLASTAALKGFKKFIDDSLLNGGKRAHAWTREFVERNTELVLREARGVDFDEQFTIRRRKWATKWQRRQEETAELAYELEKARTKAAEAYETESVEPITVLNLDAALLCFSLNTGVSLDLWDPGHVRAWPPEGRQALADFLNQCEAQVSFPIQAFLTTVSFIPKPFGGERPIAAIVFLYRVWIRIRRPRITEWEAGHAHHWDTAVAGNSALRVALRRSLRRECAIADGKFLVGAFWDGEAFYDSLSVRDILVLGQEVNYPIHDLVMGSLVHLGPRYIKANQCFDIDPIVVFSSILAGCSQATSWTKIATFRILENFSRAMRVRYRHLEAYSCGQQTPELSS